MGGCVFCFKKNGGANGKWLGFTEIILAEDDIFWHVREYGGTVSHSRYQLLNIEQW